MLEISKTNKVGEDGNFTRKQSLHNKKIILLTMPLDIKLHTKKIQI